MSGDPWSRGGGRGFAERNSPYQHAPPSYGHSDDDDDDDEPTEQSDRYRPPMISGIFDGTAVARSLREHEQVAVPAIPEKYRQPAPAPTSPPPPPQADERVGADDDDDIFTKPIGRTRAPSPPSSRPTYPASGVSGPTYQSMPHDMPSAPVAPPTWGPSAPVPPSMTEYNTLPVARPTLPPEPSLPVVVPHRESPSTLSAEPAYSPMKQATPKRRTYCCCFASRRSCCGCCCALFILLIVSIALALYFCWPRVPDVTFLGIDTGDGSSNMPTFEDGKVIMPLGLKLNVRSENYISLPVNNITAEAFMHVEETTENNTTNTVEVPVGVGSLAEKVVFAGRDDTKFTLPFKLTYDTTDPKQLSALFSVLESCGVLGDEKKQIKLSYKAKVDLPILSLFGVKPDIKDTKSIDCPYDTDALKQLPVVSNLLQTASDLISSLISGDLANLFGMSEAVSSNDTDVSNATDDTEMTAEV